MRRAVLVLSPIPTKRANIALALLAAASIVFSVCYGQSDAKPVERTCPVKDVFGTAYALGLDPFEGNEGRADCEPWLPDRQGRYLVYASGPVSDDPQHLKIVLGIVDETGRIVARLQKPWVIKRSFRQSDDRSGDRDGWVQPRSFRLLVSDLSSYEIGSGHLAFGIRIVTGPDGDDQTVISRTQTTLLLFDIDGDNIREIMSGLIVRREGFTNGGKAECDVRYSKGKTSLQMIPRKGAYSTGMVEYNSFSNRGYSEFSKCDPVPNVTPRKVYFMRTTNGIFIPPKDLQDFRFSTENN